ncbi:ABC transporter ATP-binding protein [Treponema pedis]|uniref:Hemin transport system ATP-binding protein fecE n=1 Tax=Treponema pedis str. T A4 TaxID=1291379 RepID=S6A250_9SPIR|nr:ABC transporter ATP-binding protein [Treponema pedis]AGT45083.1 hemin transport system ATP-binding protein fecE [Treponema pedis str. T A4]
MELKIENLNYEADGKKILKNISVNIPSKKMVGILGPNGAGKSTLLKHLYKNIPVKNKIFLNSKDIFEIPQKEYFRITGVLSQFNGELDTRLCAEDIVYMGRYPHKKIWQDYNKHDADIVEAALTRTGMLWAKKRNFFSLSGGERQRIITAKVFASEPEVIILDEPDNHLDIKYKMEFMKMFAEFNGTVILSMHDLNLCVKYCDEAVLLKEGEIYRAGKPKEIITEENLKSVYGVNFKILFEPEFIVYI